MADNNNPSLGQVGSMKPAASPTVAVKSAGVGKVSPKASDSAFKK